MSGARPRPADDGVAMMSVLVTMIVSAQMMRDKRPRISTEVSCAAGRMNSAWRKA